MRSEVGAESPLWTERGEMIWLQRLPITHELRTALAAWADVAWETDDPDVASEGRHLYDVLVSSLGDEYEVVWDD